MEKEMSENVIPKKENTKKDRVQIYEIQTINQKLKYTI